MATRNLTAVEGLRFLLFLGIFVFHCVSSWLPIGWGGVESFLVIGAFFLTRKQLKQEQRIKVGESFLHRIKRLYPVYITLVLCFTLALALYSRNLSWEPVWYLFSAQNFRCLFDNATYSVDTFIGHFWYISLDVWLFLVWVFILRLVPRRHLRVAFISSLCIGLLWRSLFILFVSDNVSIAYMIPIGQMDCWALGGLVALNISDNGQNNKIMWAELLIGAIGIVAITIYNASLHQCSITEAYQLYHSAEGYMHNPITGNILFFIALLSAGFLRYCIDSTKRHPILSAAPLVVLGGMTYELYCFHYPIRFVADHFIENDILMVLAALIATIVVSMLWNKWAMPIIKRVIH